MRSFLAILVSGLVAGSLSAGDGGSVEVKGPHICCAQCVRIVNQILGSVDGVSDVKPDSKTRSVSYKARDTKAAEAGLKALVEGGFYGQATLAGKELPTTVSAPAKGAQAAKVTVKEVHVCCGACQKAINKLFDGATVSYEGPGPKRTVVIAGSNLTTGQIIEALRKGGFNGTVAD